MAGEVTNTNPTLERDLLPAQTRPRCAAELASVNPVQTLDWYNLRDFESFLKGPMSADPVGGIAAMIAAHDKAIMRLQTSPSAGRATGTFYNNLTNAQSATVSGPTTPHGPGE